MALPANRGDGEAEVSIEMVDGVLDRRRPQAPVVTGPRRRGPISAVTHPAGRAALVGAAVIAYLIALSATGPRPAPEGANAAAPDVFHFGDPFAVEWEPLDAEGVASDAAHAPPMASTERQCLGFGRPDWEEESRRPTVAYCLDPIAAARLGPEGAIVVKTTLAGFDTWHLIAFGAAVAGLDATVDGRPLDGGRVYRGDAFAAILAPTDNDGVELTWTDPAGTCRRATIGEGPLVSAPCAR